MLKSQISPIFHLTTDIIVNIILVTIKKGVYPMREDIKNEFDSEEEYSTDIITLVDENDEEVTFEVLGRADYNDQSYMAAMEVFDNEEDAEDAEPYVYIFREGDPDEEGLLTYDIVEDEDELYDVQEVFKEILSEYFDFD